MQLQKSRKKIGRRLILNLDFIFLLLNRFFVMLVYHLEKKTIYINHKHIISVIGIHILNLDFVFCYSMGFITLLNGDFEFLFCDVYHFEKKIHTKISSKNCDKMIISCDLFLCWIQIK